MGVPILSNVVFGVGCQHVICLLVCATHCASHISQTLSRHEIGKAKNEEENQLF